MLHLTGVMRGNRAVEGEVKCVSVKVISDDISYPLYTILSFQNYWTV